ncbi:hypothetical protein J2P12_00030 [Candidatus Bathyarchaeota archaeon]|nr:hypothetical protein [Candidatus Bathyarchaeota archaeon]
MNSLRAELEALPKRMQLLPVDKRGYPVPWFVDWINGEPEFRAMDPKKYIQAIKEKLCWVCGGQMGIHKTFVAGPMCGINRTSSEPPSHLECARYSAKNCPFLNNPDQVRREDGLKEAIDAPGFALLRNPGVTMLWTTKTYSLFDDGKGRPLIHMGDPEAVEWYAQGRPATREEVLSSIQSGMPALMTLAMQQEGAVKYLINTREEFERRYLPL